MFIHKHLLSDGTMRTVIGNQETDGTIRYTVADPPEVQQLGAHIVVRAEVNFVHNHKGIEEAKRILQELLDSMDKDVGRSQIPLL